MAHQRPPYYTKYAHSINVSLSFSFLFFFFPHLTKRKKSKQAKKERKKEIMKKESRSAIEERKLPGCYTNTRSQIFVPVHCRWRTIFGKEIVFQFAHNHFTSNRYIVKIQFKWRRVYVSAPFDFNNMVITVIFSPSIFFCMLLLLLLLAACILIGW